MAQEVIEITEREVEIIEVIERGPAGPTGPQPDINYEVVSSARTLESADLIAADTSGGAFTLTLPANPSNGDAVDIFDFSETFDTNPLTIARNGSKIESLTEDLICNVEGAYFTLIYTGATRGWQVLPRYGTSGGGGESALTTQGDMLYRGVGINTRLPIGSAGQILKVNSGATAPEWGAAPATGVTSVGVSGSDGIEVDSGSPITGSGTIALGVNAASLRSHINVADGANNYTHPNHSGEVTSSGDGATTIANDVVTNAKLANVATATIKGRATAGTGDPEDLSASQVRTILNVADGAEANVNADWNASSGDAQILNKPSTFTPTAHAASHNYGGSDAVSRVEQARALMDTNPDNQDNTALYYTSESGAPQKWNVDAPADFRAALELGTAATADIGTGSTEVAAGDHGHGNLSSDGKLGSTAGLPVVTTSAGAVTTLALGTANQVLRVNSGATGVEFADPAASGVTGAAASASDVLGVSGANITGVDATADRLVFWDDSASKLTYGTPADAGAAAASHTHAASDITSGTINTARLASGTANSGTFLRGDQTWAAVSGVTTGSVDNAIIRADGTGGSTSQSSDLVIDDATTSTQANVAVVNAHSETNSALVLSPKGTGAFIVGPKPDGTSTGGNARGLKAVDLSFQRAAATQVASGNYSAVLGGDRCTASGATAIAGGERATASAAYAIALGRVVTASSNAATVIGGQDNTASGAESIVVGGNLSAATAHAAVAFGSYTLADRSGMMAQGNGSFVQGSTANGEAQWIHMVLRAKTTTNSAVELLINNLRTTNGRLTCPSGKIISGIINIHGVKSDGSASAHFVRQFQVKNVGGTSSYPYAAVTIGTDYASSTSITFNDPDTNGDALSVSVTGIASETWRWTAHVSAVETTYGT